MPIRNSLADTPLSTGAVRPARRSRAQRRRQPGADGEDRTGIGSAHQIAWLHDRAGTELPVIGPGAWLSLGGRRGSADELGMASHEARISMDAGSLQRG
jgi:hypothetical protein